MQVVGADWAAKQWACVVLEDGSVKEVIGYKAFADLVASTPSPTTIGVDIPVGLPDTGPTRRADMAARQIVRSSTVFPTYPRDVYEAPTHAEAVRICRAREWPGVSRQSYGLWARISEVEPFAGRVHEVHPELAFHAMNDGPLSASKHTWNGFFARRRLLANEGIDIPEALPNGLPLIDVLDAAAVAWSAHRIATGKAHRLPIDPQPGEPTISY